MYGYQFALRITEGSWGFGSTGTFPNGFYLDADSESLSQNIEYEEGANKLKGDRSIIKSDFVQRVSSPGGAVPIQPRSDNAWLLFLNCFQCGDATGTLLAGTMFRGTLTFTPSRSGNFNFTGSTIGTVVSNVGTCSNVHALQVLKLYGGDANGATNAIEYNSSLVDTMQLRFTYGEDVILEPTFKSYQARAATLVSAFFNPPSSAGSFSTKQRLADWHATLNIDSTTFNLQSLNMTFNNQLGERGRIGKFGFTKFPFGKILHEGELSLEFDSATYFPVAGTGTITALIYGGTNDWIRIVQNNAVWRSHDPQASGGDTVVEETVPYRAVMDNSKTVAETIVQICCVIDNAGSSSWLLQSGRVHA